MTYSKSRPLKQIKSFTAKHLDEREYTDLKITRTDISIILWFDSKLVQCKVGKLFLRWMSSNYKLVEGIIESNYSHWLAIGSELINLEMLDICILEKYNEAELKFYKKMLEMIWAFKNSKVLIIVPIKHNIPIFQSRTSFDFEVNILDFRHIYRLRWNSDYLLNEILSLLDKIDNQTLIEVFIERFTTDGYNWQFYLNK